MKLSLLLDLARARVDIGRIGGNNSPSAYQPECPPQEWIDLFRHKIIIYALKNKETLISFLYWDDPVSLLIINYLIKISKIVC